MNASQSVAPIQGRWGFHPCDFATYQKLRRLNSLAYRCRVVGGAWERWNRKLPKNRIIRQTIRDTSGRPIRREPKLDSAGNVIPIPEPRRPLTYKGIKIPGSYFECNIIDAIEGDYRNARCPRKTAEEVKPLALSIQQIEEELTRLEKWAGGCPNG